MTWVLAAAADLLLGGVCAGCGRPGVAACPSCRLRLGRAPVHRVARPLPGFPRTFARGHYGEELRGLLIAFKERQRLGLGPVLGDALVPALARLLLEHPAPQVCLVPAPSAASRIRERGYDVTWIMARRAASGLRSLGVRARAGRWLRQRPGMRDQSELDREHRRVNASGGLVAAHAGAAVVIVVDDIVTTGSTLCAATAALATAGHRVLGAAVIADTRRLGPRG